MLRFLSAALCLGVLAGQAWSQEPNKWAVVIGISRFQHLTPDQHLQFADRDAEAFDAFIRSPRGGGFPEENVRLLVNEQATLARIRETLQWLSRSVKRNDRVYFYLAAHGMVEAAAPRAAYLLAYDSNPADLFVSGLAMKDLAEVFGDRISGRIVLFADIARGGKLGERQRGIHRHIEAGAGKNSELIGLVASRPNEFSQEGKQFGGGHGAFTHFLLEGLNGAADADRDQIVGVSELIRYLTDQIPRGTDNQQHIREFGNFDNEVPVSFPAKSNVSARRAAGR